MTPSGYSELYSDPHHPLGTGRTVRISTGAKLNLYLRVLGRRQDGYHDIETVFHGIALCDELELTPADGAAIRLEVVAAPGAAAALPAPEDNLVVRAARRLLEVCGAERGVSMRLTKRVPVGAGLGGGSANAAGALLALNEVWGCRLEHEALVSAATSLGSDVAYCLMGGTAIGKARGERLTPVPAPAVLWFVLGISREPLWTREVYARWTESAPVAPGGAAVPPGGAAVPSGSAAVARAMAAGEPAPIGRLLHNDLERAVFALRPELSAAKEALVRAGALGACVTGSGPTLFGVARDEAHARAVAARVEDRFDRVEVVRSRPRSVEGVG